MLLALWCACYASGIVAAWAVSFAVTPSLVAGGCALVAAGGLAWRRRGRAAGAALFFAVGMALAVRAMGAPRLPAVVAAAVASERPVIVEGQIIQGPEAATRGVHLTVALQRVDGEPASGMLALSVLSGWPDVAPGEQLRFRVRLRAVRGLRNPGLPDPAIAFRAAGITLLGGVVSAGELTRVGALPPPGPWRLAFQARQVLRGAIQDAVKGDELAFLRTAVLGERRGVGDEVEAGFRAAGATHVLSVSGLHLASVAALFFLIVRTVMLRIPRLPLYLDPRAAAAALALPAVAFYALLTGAAVATLRSAVMIGVGLGALMFGRAPSGSAAVAAAGLALLVGSPLMLFDPSLQLSFASVIAMLVLARPLGPRGPASGWVVRAGHWLWRFGAASLSATAATAPLVAHHFGEVAPASLVGNLALVPLVELVVVPCGLLGAVLGAAMPVLGAVPLAVARYGARGALAVAAAFKSHAPLWLVRMPTPLETAALILGAVLVLVVIARRGPRLAVAGAVLALAVAAVSLEARHLARTGDPSLRVTFLDVGQGDAALIESPGGRTILVDGGGTYDGSFDPGERVIEPFLRRRGITAVDLMVLSHAHPDHLNGLHRILERFAVGALWTSGDDAHNPDYARLLATAKARETPLPIPVAQVWGPLAVGPLGPWLGDGIAAPPGISVNDASLVLRVDFAGRGLIFAGDLEADGEGELIGRVTAGQAVRADVLKVPHHGSRTSSSDELLDAVGPALAVISLGWQNRFHFPAPEVLARYAARHIRVLRTDRDGAVTVTITSAGALEVACERGCPMR